MLPPDTAEVHSIVMNLKNESAPGWDKITARVLKLAMPLLLEPITLICQKSFETGVFPAVLKSSIVCPIYKGGTDDDITNYRPISLLSVISKVLEKLMNNRLKNYLEKKKLLSNNQYGFRSMRCTEDAVLGVSEHITKTLDEGKKPIAVFLDLAKAFDTVSIPMLLAKLERVGVRGLPWLWFKSYMTHRTQKTRVGQYLSDEAEVLFGVPQGSILGPTLFLIYINELCDMTLHNGKVITYADDTVLLFHGRTWPEVESIANNGLNTVSRWLRNNLLTINIAKTKYIAFSLNNSTQPKQPLNLQMHGASCSQLQKSCNCQYLETTDSIKYLGVLIDKNLSWKGHVKHISGRTRKMIYIFKQLRHAMTLQSLKKVYFALSQSILTYCIRAWGAADKTTLLQLERAQRALLKVILFRPRYYSTSALYEECSVLSIRKLYIKAIIGKQHSLVTLDKITLSELKRRKDKVFKVPASRTKLGRKSLRIMGPKLYNRVSQNRAIVQMSYRQVNITLMDFLGNLTYYDDTEKLMTNIS